MHSTLFSRGELPATCDSGFAKGNISLPPAVRTGGSVLKAALAPAFGEHPPPLAHSGAGPSPGAGFGMAAAP